MATLYAFFGWSFLQNDTLFKKANTLYNNGKYLEAIDNYMSILETNTHSAELYFNLGNAHYKLNNIATSIYYYEKALQLKPNDKDIINNIAFARNMTIDAIDTVPEVGFSDAGTSVDGMFRNQRHHEVPIPDSWQRSAHSDGVGTGGRRANAHQTLLPTVL